VSYRLSSAAACSAASFNSGAILRLRVAVFRPYIFVTAFA